MINNDTKTYFSLYSEGLEHEDSIKGEELNLSTLSKYVKYSNSSTNYTYEQILIWTGNDTLPKEKNWSLLNINSLGIIHPSLFGIDTLKIPYSWNKGKKKNTTHKQNKREYRDKAKKGIMRSAINDIILDEVRSEYGSIVKGRKFDCDYYADYGYRQRKAKDWKNNKCMAQWAKHKTTKVKGLRDKWEKQAWAEMKNEEYLEELNAS